MNNKKVLVSACLAGKSCRYDGNNNLVQDLKALCDEGKAIMVCPEAMGGLPTPRAPAEIIETSEGKSVITKTGEDVTHEFELGAKLTLELAKQNHIEYAILKAKSPSCGCGKIYDGSFDMKLKDGNGLTAELLIENGIAVYNEDSYQVKSK